MTDPVLARATPFGRLYTRPGGAVFPVAGFTPRQVNAAVDEGVLVPSVTNVLGVRSSDHLVGWAARKAAGAAVDSVLEWTENAAANPEKAKRWAASAADRDRDDRAVLGSLVHAVAEARVLGAAEPSFAHDERAVRMVRAWEDFMAAHHVKVEAAEATVFGAVSGLGYAGTGDLIAVMDTPEGRQRVLADYKTGRSVHADASLQLAALAAAGEVACGDEVQPFEGPSLQVIVHLTMSGFVVYPAADRFDRMAVFTSLRQAWDFHCRHESQAMGSAWPKPAVPAVA